MNNITKILIPIRGEIACRILGTLNRMDIPGVVVYHAVDEDSPAVHQAAESIEIHGPTPVSAYLDVEQIIKVCRQTGADAVHPGFGFLAENAQFARQLAKEGITFIGPLPETIELMGNKVAARAFCIENNLPLAPSVIEEDTGKTFIESAIEIGVPLLIKAASGGGGKGMHIVRDLDEMEKAVQLAKGEAKRSFGNDEVYAERYVENPRHIEVQVLADQHGKVLHLGERDCSIQRRYQKVIEESPAPALAPELRERICNTAVEITRKAGYHNAGTIEFILASDGEFFFLEMNTRLQVEHPVTEMVTGLDLVELQIRIARGESLSMDQEQIQTEGHAIELRLYAEDPENDFLPATGPLLVYQMPTGEAVRVENGFTEGMTVSSAFDPMLAKLIVHGKDRKQAIEQGVKALEETLVLGVTTNADYLKQILSHPAYSAAQIHTGFIPLHEQDLKPKQLSEEERNMLLATAALSSREFTNPAFNAPEPYAFLGNWRN